jgi:TPR repeat protein
VNCFINIINSCQSGIQPPLSPIIKRRYKKAARDENNVYAQTKLGSIYERSGNIPEAVKYYKAAAEAQGFAIAQYCLADCYQTSLAEGKGLEKGTQEEVTNLYISAAWQKYAPASCVK